MSPMYLKSKVNKSTYSSAQDAGAPHLSQLPSGGVQLGGSEAGVDVMVEMSIECGLNLLGSKGTTVS